MLEDIGYTFAYAGVGVVMLALGFLALDLLTPGKLAKHVWDERSINAGIVLSSGFLGIGVVIWAAIWYHATNGFGEALQYTVVFGLIGVVLQAVAYVLLDLITPGKLGDAICDTRFHPASLVTAASQLAVSLVVVASIV
jgi:uncharacterized membrane protein YjfL (UPF0719 family)